MEKTFIDVLSHFKKNKDHSSIEFVRYVMVKYFDEKKVFMPVKDAIPYLEPEDRRQLEILIVSCRGF
mgnify:CR=1 FL=1|jgi:hypothetical protein|tara:strand:- start:239 stop:439 length:201 start_codon:yes stop_codon:yes gene_type:complete